MMAGETGEYWLTQAPDQIGAAVDDRFRKHLEELFRRGRLGRIQEATNRYYNEGGVIEFGGEAGELVMVRVNHFRSLITTTLSMTTSQRPAYEATATDDTSESAARSTARNGPGESPLLSTRRNPASRRPGETPSNAKPKKAT
jgi:hypothetical protein